MWGMIPPTAWRAHWRASFSLLWRTNPFSWLVRLITVGTDSPFSSHCPQAGIRNRPCQKKQWRERDERVRKDCILLEHRRLKVIQWLLGPTAENPRGRNLHKQNPVNSHCTKYIFIDNWVTHWRTHTHTQKIYLSHFTPKFKGKIKTFKTFCIVYRVEISKLTRCPVTWMINPTQAPCKFLNLPTFLQNFSASRWNKH